jgi:succinoglycan biosynthesis transport protein ExoP
MNLKEISYSVKKWSLILALGLVLGMTTGLIGGLLQKPVYQATAKILLASSSQTKIGDFVLTNDQQIIQTYVELLKTKPLLDMVSSKLGLVIDPLKISVSQGTSNQIIHVIVENNDSQRAAQIANTLIQELIDLTNASQINQYSTYETALNTQIEVIQKQIGSLQGQIEKINEGNIQEQLTQVNGQITQLNAEISALELDISNSPFAISIAEKKSQLEQKKSLMSIYQQIQTNLIYIGQPAQINSSRGEIRIASIQLTLNLYQQLYVNLMNNLQTFQLNRFQNLPIVTEIDPAIPSVEPIRPKPILYMILAGIAGLLLALGGILLQSYFDDTLKFPSDAEELLGLSVIAAIPNIQLHKGGSTLTNPLIARDTQGIRKLVAFLELSTVKKPLQTLMITSSGAAEGKTTIASSLAAAYSKQGKRVLLIDANFNNPYLHILFGLENEKGFSEILFGNKDSIPQLYPPEDDFGFFVLPAGQINQSWDLYQVGKVNQIFKRLLREYADLIILDAPPITNADANMLAAESDGVLFLIQSGRTKIGSALSATQQLKRQDAQVLGIVLNRGHETL